MKNTKKSKTTENQVVTNNNESINWNAKYYREKNAAFYNSSSYCPPSEPVVFTMSKSVRKAEIKTGLEAAKKVRHNRPLENTKAVPSVVMIGGVPHKLRDGKLVKLIPAAKSKKWDIVEA